MAHLIQPVRVYIALVLGMLVLLTWQLHEAPDASSFGHKARLIDIWILGHFLFGIILMGFWKRLTHQHRFLMVVASICVWEAIELTMEIGLFGSGPEDWMAGVEPPMNRYLIDPLIGILGAVTCHLFPKIWLPSFIIGLVFEIANVASPTAMTIQQTLLDFFLAP